MLKMNNKLLVFIKIIWLYGIKLLEMILKLNHSQIIIKCVNIIIMYRNI